ncbi:MAG: ABC transporter permease subunit [Streptomycetales bacterium]
MSGEAASGASPPAPRDTPEARRDTPPEARRETLRETGWRARRGDLVGLLVLCVLLVCFPLVAPTGVVTVGIFALIYAVAALGLSLLMGLAGQVSLGQAGFFAVGAYTQAILVTRYSVNGVLAALAAATLAMVVAALVGLPLLRLRGHYLALATLGFGIIITVLASESSYTGGTSGIYGIPKPEFNHRVYDEPAEYFWLVAPIVVLGVLMARNIASSRVGRALGAVNDSEVAAATLGVNTFRLRLQVLVVSALYASVAGTAFAHWLSVVNPNAANFTLSVKFLLMSVFGGLATVWGAVVGAFAIEGLDEGLRTLIPALLPGAQGEVQLIGFGVVLTALVVFLPGGIHQAYRWALEGLRPRSAARAVGPAGQEARPTRAGKGRPAQFVRRGRPPAGTRLLEVEGLTKTFGGVRAVEDVSLAVSSAEILALIGPNGAGKTTLFNMISGVIPPSGGTVTLAGRRIEGRKPHVFASARATRTFQNLQIFASMTVVGNVMVARHLRSRAGLVRAALVVPAITEERSIEREARRIVQLVGLGSDADRPAAELPFGRQRLIEIARALASEPDLLLLDEPMAGLSGAERRELAALLRQVRASGIGIVLVEHDVEAVLALADRVAVLEDGRLIALGAPERVRADPAVVAAYLGVEKGEPASSTVLRGSTARRPGGDTGGVS